ncbi:MAG: sigma factor [Heteroscytonema crispum UTEX LB 1556]
MKSEYVSELYELLLASPEYQQTVKRIARKQTIGTSTPWEDAAQTAHERIIKATKAGKFGKGGVKEFYHWAAQVAKNAIIDCVRQDKHFIYKSLDQTIPGTDLFLVDTVADEFNLLEAIEFKDLFLRTIETIKQLDGHYPDRGYIKLWEGVKQGKNQSQLAVELGITQGAISKRWKELSLRVAQTLGLFALENVKQQLQPNCHRNLI